MPGFSSRPPDMNAILIGVLSDLALTKTTVPQLTNPCRFLIVRSELQNRVTHISRYCRVGVEAWSIRADGSTDHEDAFDLAADAAMTIESTPRTRGMILAAEVESGPSSVKDPIKGIEFQFLTALLEVAV